MGERPDVRSHSSSSTSRPNADGDAISVPIAPTSPMPCEPGDLTPLLTIQTQVRQWFSEYQPICGPCLGGAFGGS